MLSAFSQEQLVTHIKQVLSDGLSDQAVKDCIKALEIIEPPVAKQFWQAITAKPGIYIVLTGKVRLLDSANNLINTLTPGSSFGELTLFPEREFSSYVARASVNLKIAYLPEQIVKKIIGQFPHVYDLLLHKAELINTSKSSEIPIIETVKTVKSSNFVQPIISKSIQSQKSPKYFPIPTVIAGNWWRKFTKRYPFFEQQSAADCGAACLVMVGRYWGKNLSINRLRDLTNISRSGASMRSLSAAAESLGFATRPVKASLDKFAQQPLPAIAHWQGKHYIVVYEITKKQVIIADPAIGQRQLNIKEFLAGWTGYALLLQPTASLKKTQEANTPFWQLLDLVKPHFQVLLEVFTASVLIQVFGLVTPLFTQLLLDRVIVQGSVLTLNTVGFGLLIFGLFRVAINGLRQYLLDHTANRISVALMVGFIKHTFSLPLSFFESRYVGDIVSRVQENQKIQRFLTGEALSIGLDLLTVFVYIGLMFWYSPPMALMTLSIVPKH
jgi:ATP-binding cassette subfamily B protein